MCLIKLFCCPNWPFWCTSFDVQGWERWVETEKPIEKRVLFSPQLCCPTADGNFEPNTPKYQHILFFLIYIFCQPQSKTQDESFKQLERSWEKSIFCVKLSKQEDERGSNEWTGHWKPQTQQRQTNGRRSRGEGEEAHSFSKWGRETRKKWTVQRWEEGQIHTTEEFEAKRWTWKVLTMLLFFHILLH